MRREATEDSSVTKRAGAAGFQTLAWPPAMCETLREFPDLSKHLQGLSPH